MLKVLVTIALVALAAVFVIGNHGLEERAQAATLVPYQELPAQENSFAFMPSAPDKKAAKPADAAQKKEVAIALAPVKLSIPSIGLNNKVVKMGLDSKGDLDVPSGSTGNIGWYAKGIVPGEMGSAVMDAHVFAAFSELHKVKAGDDIYVVMNDGSRKRFVVNRTKVYALEDLSSNELFSRRDGRYLHLITCAGELTEDRSTYTHRLVVYAELAD